MLNAVASRIHGRGGILHRLLVPALVMGLAGCAQSPETVAPTQVSTVPYQKMDCRALTAQVAEMDRGLAALYVRQRTVQLNDVSKGIFFLHPRGTVVGPDIVPSLALAKGERYAAGAVLQARC